MRSDTDVGAGADPVALLSAAVAGLAAVDVRQCSDAELGEQIVALTGLAARVEGERLRRLAVFDGRGAGGGSRGGSTAGWLGWQTRSGPRQAARTVRLARELDRRLPATAAALVAGQISVGHAEALARGTADLAEAVVAAGRTDAAGRGPRR